MPELRTVDFALERLSEAGYYALSGDQRILWPAEAFDA
jgi:hypothetical protein